MPEISVILPFYNAEAFLERSVRSILLQSFRDLELILINNNSTDASVRIAERFARNDSRVKVYREYTQGVVFASQTGFEKSSADLIARADADDQWHPDKLRKQFDLMVKDPDIDVVACSVNFKGPDHAEGMKAYVDETNRYLSHDEISLNRFSELQVINPSILFKKEIVLKYGFYKNGAFPEDYEMFLRWSENGVKYKKLPDKLLDWYDHENRLTRTDDRYSSDAFYMIKAEYLNRYLRSHDPYYPKIWLWGAGKTSKQRIRYLTNLGVEIERFIDVDPKKTRNEDVIHYKDLPEPGNCFIVSYVNNRGKRQEIRSFLQSKKYAEGKDFILA